MEKSINCLVCDRYDDVAVPVISLDSSAKYTLSLMLSETDFYSDDVLCFGCHGKLTISTSFLKMCRSSHRSFNRQQNQFKNESEQVEQSEAIIDSEDYQTVYIEDFTDTDVERLEEGDVEGDPETCLEVSHIESEEEGEDVISELDEKYSKDDIKTIIPMETPVKVLDTHDFHDIPSNLVCDDCNKSFGTMKSYRTHVLLIHSDNDIQSQEHLFKVKKRDIYTDADYDDLTCEYCFDKFNNPEQRKDHETSHLEEDRPYRCNVCTQQFPTRTTLRGHYESHMKLTWSCSYEGCEKTFKTKHGRWTHEYKHKNASRPCPVCGKLLKTTWAINQHIKQMHTELPLVHECAKCSKKFKTQKALYNHAIIHDENKKTHECRICVKRFFTKSKLTRHHDQVHSGKKPFSCTQKGCSYKGGNIYNGNRHLLIHQGVQIE